MCRSATNVTRVRWAAYGVGEMSTGTVIAGFRWRGAHDAGRRGRGPARRCGSVEIGVWKSRYSLPIEWSA